MTENDNAFTWTLFTSTEMSHTWWMCAEQTTKEKREHLAAVSVALYPCCWWLFHCYCGCIFIICHCRKEKPENLLQKAYVKGQLVSTHRSKWTKDNKKKKSMKQTNMHRHNAFNYTIFYSSIFFYFSSTISHLRVSYSRKWCIRYSCFVQRLLCLVHRK